MEFKREAIINQPIEQVWDVLGNQFTEAYRWASGLKHSEGFGQPKLQGAACSNRSCDTTSGAIKEEIKTFDAKNYELEYEVIEGFPFFVDKGMNNWKLTKQGNQTKVNMHLTIKTKGVVGTIMTPMMKMQMGGIASNAIEDFRHYAETGQPSPKKAKEIQKFGLSIAY